MLTEKLKKNSKMVCVNIEHEKYKNRTFIKVLDLLNPSFCRKRLLTFFNGSQRLVKYVCLRREWVIGKPIPG